MGLATFIFWFVALVTLTSAVLVVSARKILHAAFALCLTFLGVGALYLFLQADFVAAVQLIVYVGGILVLILFAVMFSSNTASEDGELRRSRIALGAGAVTALATFAAVCLLIRRLHTPLAQANQFADAAYASTVSAANGQTGLGHLLVGRYLLPFELVSILLLAALVGAVVIVRKETN